MEAVHTGTTILACRCTDGVVIAADTRASVSSIVFDRNMTKIASITPDIYVAFSGVASAAQAIVQYARYYMNCLAINSERRTRVKVSVVAQICRKLIQSNKQFLQVMMIVAGMDDDGPHVFSVSHTGMLIEREIATGGSGSIYNTAYCDEHFKSGMTTGDAAKFLISAVSHSIVRDGYSGGPIRLVRVTKDGAMTKTVAPPDQPVSDSVVRT